MIGSSFLGLGGQCVYALADISHFYRSCLYLEPCEWQPAEWSILERHSKGANIPLATQVDVHPCNTILVYFLVDVRREGNGTHDTVAELLVDHCLVCVAIILHDFVQSVYERLLGWHRDAPSPVWKARELCCKSALINAEVFGKLRHILFRSSALAVKDGSNSYLGPSKFLCNSFEGDLLLCLRVEQGRRGGGETGMLRSLVPSVLVIGSLLRRCTYIQCRERGAIAGVGSGHSCSLKRERSVTLEDCCCLSWRFSAQGKTCQRSQTSSHGEHLVQVFICTSWDLILLQCPWRPLCWNLC